MNYRLITNQAALLIVVLAGAMAVMAAGFYLAEWLAGTPVSAAARLALIITAGAGALVGGGVWLSTRGQSEIEPGRREALLLVALSWLVGAAVAATPFYLWAKLAGPSYDQHPFHSFTDCYFEAMSGLTTTGATILPDIETLPDALLLWRAVTHWLGGLGIVVLFVAVLPSIGVGAKKLFRVEATSASRGSVRPHIRETARVLWLIYLGVTVVLVLALRLTGAMDWFDAVCHAFSTLSTGGFSTYNASIGAFDSTAVNVITTLFMFLAGVNFALFYEIVKGRWRNAWKDVELRVYFVLKILVLVVVAWDIFGTNFTLTNGDAVVDAGLGVALDQSAFVTMSMQTGTGFGTADYERWPYLSQALLIGLMLIGGCAGSTAGGVKVIRFWVAIKVLLAEIEKAFRPNVVRPIKVGGATLEPDSRLSAIAYVVGMLFAFGVGAVMIEICEPGPAGDNTTSFTAAMATLCNVGPGLGLIGPTETYAFFDWKSKWVMSVMMALGRLEFFAILVLFSPRYWKAD